MRHGRSTRPPADPVRSNPCSRRLSSEAGWGAPHRARGGLRARQGGGVLFAVDPHRGTGLHRAEGVLDTFDAFGANVRSAGLADYVRTVRAPSIEARDGFKDCSIELLFIDASHSYEDVRADLEAWSGALTDIAAVGFHDVHAEPA